MIYSITNFVYELPHELSNDLRLDLCKLLKKSQLLDKSQIWVETEPSNLFFSRNQSLAIPGKIGIPKVGTKHFLPFRILLDFSVLFQIFYP